MTHKLRYSVTDLGVLPGFDESRAAAINDDGQIVGTLRRGELSDFEFYGFSWDDGQMSGLDAIIPQDINNQGQIVGSKGVTELMASLAHGGSVKTVFPHRSNISMAEAINDAGQIVGYSQLTGRKAPSKTKRWAFVWEDSKTRSLTIPVGYRVGKASGINGLGVIVGDVWLEHPNDEHAVIWDAEQARLLGEPEGFTNTSAKAINTQGHVLIRATEDNYYKLLMESAQGIPFLGWNEGQDCGRDFEEWGRKMSAIPKDAWHSHHQPFLWKEGHWHRLDNLSSALDLNDSDQVVGWISGDYLAEPGKTPGESHAALWQNGKVIDLNNALPSDADWTLKRATGINNHGQIIGNGVFEDKHRAFLLTPEHL